MLKKIVIGSLFALLSGGLIYGGVIRTEARVEAENFGGQRQNQIRQEQDNRQQNLYENRNETSGYRGGEGNTPRESQGQAAENYSTNFVSGTVMDATEDYLSIQTDDKGEIVIENRAWWYALEAGFSASPGESVELKGFYDDSGVFEVSWIANITTGVEIAIRDEGGRPNWAGGGGGGGRNGRS